MLTSQSTLSTIILGLSLTAHCVKAYTTTLNSTQLAPSSGLVPPLVTGPVALNQMLPLKLYVGAGNTPGAGQYSETTDLQNSLCSNGGGSNGVNYDLQSHSYNAIRSTANIYLIYFTAGQISGNQQALIQNFVTNIGSTNYWNTVRQYIYNGYIPATPSYQNSVVVSPYSTIGMSMTENNAQDLLLYVFTKVNSGFKD